MSADEPCGYKYGVIDIQILSHGCQSETWWCRCRCAEGTPYVGRVHACVRACVSTGSQPASLRMCGSKIDLLTQGQTPRGEERHGHDDNGDISDSLMLQFPMSRNSPYPIAKDKLHCLFVLLCKQYNEVASKARVKWNKNRGCNQLLCYATI